MRHLLPGFLFIVACAGPEAETTPPTETGTPLTDTTDTPTSDTQEPPQGACGDVTVWDLTLRGRVLEQTGRPALAATVTLEDRGWAPITVLGTATTNAEGNFEMAVTDLTSVEDCWATLLDYVVVAERGTEYGELEANTELFGAINDGTLIADLSLFPVQMEDTAR